VGGRPGRMVTDLERFVLQACLGRLGRKPALATNFAGFGPELLAAKKKRTIGIRKGLSLEGPFVRQGFYGRPQAQFRVVLGRDMENFANLGKKSQRPNKSHSDSLCEKRKFELLYQAMAVRTSHP